MELSTEGTSVPEEASQEAADPPLREDAPEDQKDKTTRTSDPLRTSQRERRTISTLSLFKEDFTQFKEELLKVFRDSKTEPEDQTLTQAEGKPVSSTLDLLKEDLNQLREDVTSVFSSNRDAKSADLKTSQSTERTNNRRSFFKDDLSNVFRISLLKDRDTAKEDPSKIKASSSERADEPFLSLFRRDQKTFNKVQTCQETVSEPSEGLEDPSETTDTKETTNEKTDEGQDDEEEESVCEEEQGSVSETPQTEDMIPSEETVLLLNPLAEQSCESEEKSEDVPQSEDGERINEEEEKKEEDDDGDDGDDDDGGDDDEDLAAETVLSLSSVISLFSPRDQNKDDTRNHKEGDLWSVKNFACYLTFDPNTANSELHLTDGNRTATRVWSDHRPSDHPDRFERCPQVLCREGLLDSVYWEVVWSGGADIGVTYNNICRNGDPASCLLGHNELSWSLECAEGCYTPCHANKRFKSSSPQPFTHRVGVYLDWSAGALSFYCVSKDTMVHLHTFTSTFSEPLYPAFWVWDYKGSVSLCQVELDWERLLQ